MTTDISLAKRDVPARRGQFFGSANCCHGRLCTFEAFEQATREARELTAHLGPGWEPRVWENLGWHYEATLTSGEHTIYVHASTVGSHVGGGWAVVGYAASFNYLQWQRAKTPEGAVIKVIEAIRAEMDHLGEVLANATHTIARALPEDTAR